MVPTGFSGVPPSGPAIPVVEIPMSVRAAEISTEGSSIYVYDPKGKAACAYSALIKEVMNNG